MFSEKAKKNADACRFCWMCRHLCPVQLATGKETNTPRAKGLLVSLINRGMDMDADTAKIMYECMLCGACTNDCVTGFDPLVYTREARTEAVVRGIAPESVMHVIDRVEESGNIYGAKEPLVDLSGASETGDTLLWLGATARYSTPETAKAYMSLLEKAKVHFAVIKDEPASGCALFDLMGEVEDARAQAMNVGAVIRATGAKLVIVLDSYDAALMRHEYANWGVELPELVTATAFIDALIKQGRLKPEEKHEIVTCHDPSRLARDLDEHQPLRDILTAMGCEIHDMFLTKRLSACCGSSLVGQYTPSLRDKTAENRWEHVLRTDARVLVSCCPQSTEAFSRSVPNGCEYRDLFVWLDERVVRNEV